MASGFRAGLYYTLRLAL